MRRVSEDENTHFSDSNACIDKTIGKYHKVHQFAVRMWHISSDNDGDIEQVSWSCISSIAGRAARIRFRETEFRNIQTEIWIARALKEKAPFFLAYPSMRISQNAETGKISAWFKEIFVSGEVVNPSFLKGSIAPLIRDCDVSRRFAPNSPLLWPWFSWEYRRTVWYFKQSKVNTRNWRLIPHVHFGGNWKMQSPSPSPKPLSFDSENLPKSISLMLILFVSTMECRADLLGWDVEGAT
jgi:hypothetical protein